MLLIAWTFLPQTYEVWLSVTNVQWVMGVSMLLVLVMPEDVLNRCKMLIFSWAVVCGLAGIPAVLLSPLFLIRAVMRRSGGSAAAASGLVLAGAIELACILTFGTPGRSYPLDPILLSVVPLLQTTIEPFAGVDFTHALGNVVRQEYPGIGPATLSVLFGGSGLILLIAFAVHRSVGRDLSFYVLAAWGFISIIQTFAALNLNPRYLVGAGSRYYLLGSVALCVLLAWGTTASHRVIRASAFAALALISAVGLIQRAASSWPNMFLSGPSWKQQIRACRHKATCHVVIWPGGGTWFVDITELE